MDWINVFLILAIGFIQVFFSSKLSTKIFEENSKSCSDFKYDTPEYKSCHKDYTQNKSDQDTKKFVFMMIVGIISLMIVYNLDANNTIRYGVGLGGLMTIIYALFMNWSSMNETIRLCVLGVSFVSLLYIGSRGTSLLQN